MTRRHVWTPALLGVLAAVALLAVYVWIGVL